MLEAKIRLYREVDKSHESTSIVEEIDYEGYEPQIVTLELEDADEVTFVSDDDAVFPKAEEDWGTIDKAGIFFLVDTFDFCPYFFTINKDVWEGDQLQLVDVEVQIDHDDLDEWIEMRKGQQGLASLLGFDKIGFRGNER